MELSDIVVFLAWFIGGFINGVTGFGCNIVGMPLMAYVTNPHLSILVSCIVGAGITSVFGILYHKHCDYSEFIPLITAFLPCSFLGLYVFSVASTVMLQYFLGIFLLLYVLWQWLSQYHTPVRLGKHLSWAVATGMFAGLCHGAISIPGPPIAVYASMRRWDKNTCLGTFGMFFAICSLLVFFIQLSKGFYTAEVWKSTMVALPGGILGLVASIPFIKRINPKFFRILMLLLLAVSGLMLLHRAALG